ncbi:MAG: ribosome recycling factor [Flavobacteriia bacterium]|nr:MAG: ribosome recycling factor [Flavobacteriia bacterium]
MNEDIQFLLDSLKEELEKAINHLEKEYRSIRAGKANPSMLSSVTVEYYGSQTPLSQVANVNTMDAHTLTIQPWEKNLLGDIEKAIHAANLGFNPNNNGDFIIINVPALTEERRKELVKQAKAEAENAKVSLRNDRRETLHELKKLDLSEDLHKNVEIDIQEIIDKYSKKVDEYFDVKEKEIMTV